MNTLWVVQAREKTSDEWEFCESLDLNMCEGVFAHLSKESAEEEHLEWVENGGWEYRLVEVEIKAKEVVQ